MTWSQDGLTLRESRRIRSAEINVLVDSNDGLRIEVASAQHLLNEELNKSDIASSSQEDVIREFDKLQVSQNKLLSCKAKLEAEIRRLRLKIDAEKAALHLAETSREWARPGPELDALRVAKLDLAQVLTDIDEARLRERKDLNALHRQLEEAERENSELKREAKRNESWLSWILDD